MAFGRLGAMGAGFGHLGASFGGSIPPGGEGLLVGEADGFAIDFTYPVDALRVAVKVAGVVTKYGLDAFITTASTLAKLVFDANGTLVWSPHNMFLNSAAPATQSVTTAVGQNYTVAVTGTGTVTGSAGASGVASAGSPLTYTATTTTSTFTVAGSPTTIQMNRGPVATAYLATTAAIRYGVVVNYDAVTHAARGMFGELQNTNYCTWGNDLTNAAWVKSNMTAAKTATGPDASTNGASTITATAGNATALQTFINVSQLRNTSVFLKRRTGSGNVDLTQDNGSTWTTQAVTSTWTRFTLTAQTLTDPVMGIRIVTSGDAVDVAFFQHEVGANSVIASSPIPTFAAAGARAEDSFSVTPASINYSATAGSWWIDATPIAPVASRVLGYTAGTAAPFFMSSATQMNVFDGTNLSKTGLTLHANFRAACGFQSGARALAVNGLTVVTDAGSTTNLLVPGAGIFFGRGSAATSSINGNIAKLAYVPRKLSNAELVAKTA